MMNERTIDLPQAQQIDYKWVAIGDTFRPAELQRSMDDAHVDRIVANWNDAAFGAPILSYREHGNRGPRGEAYAIVAGQHRMAAASKVGKTRVYCAVVYGLDAAGEARLFIDEDRRKQQSALGKFHLARLSGDLEAQAVWDIANECGFIIARTNNDTGRRMLRGIAPVMRAYRRGNLHAVLTVIGHAFDNNKKGAILIIIDGLSMLLRCRPDIDKSRLADKIGAVGPDAIMQRYRAGIASMGSGTSQVTMANALIGVYNSNLQEARKIDTIAFSEVRNAVSRMTTEDNRRGGLVSGEIRRMKSTGKTLAEARAEVAARRAAGEAV